MKRKAFAVILAVCIVVICAIGISTCRGKSENIEDVLAAAQQYILDGNYQEAIAAFNKAIEIDPKNPDAYNGLYTAYVENKDYANAWETVQKGIEANGGDPDNSTEPDTDSPDPLQGLDLLIHNRNVLVRIMSNPIRIVSETNGNTFVTDYEYEFDDNGYITYVKETHENSVIEARYTNNSVGIHETVDRPQWRDYQLTKTDTNYIATYSIDSFNSNGAIEEIYDLNGNLLQSIHPMKDIYAGWEYTVTYSYTYDENGDLQVREITSSDSAEKTRTYYEKNTPLRTEYSEMATRSDGWECNREEYTNRFDEYGRIVQIDCVFVNTETSESKYMFTEKYYYYDTLED